MNKIYILASGSGTNAENLIIFFKNDKNTSIEGVISNKKDAFVHERAKRLGVPSYYFQKSEFEDDTVLKFLQEKGCNFIILAGFLLLVPPSLIKNYPNKIINIHPALLPKYGGKGMYGMNVHQAVVDNKETESGITIHFVNEHYDEGTTIFQAKCEVNESDTAEDVANKIHALEYEYFPRVIKEILDKM